ncbi:MAG: HTH domain-containing protein [Clostridia bacterium]|nr:HTH domain-containing protein [Clostridia bacterium]
MQLYIMMGVLLALMQNGKMTASQLAHKFEVSTRSIYRYVDSLSLNGVPIATDLGRYGGIYLTEQFNLENIFFTKQELLKMQDSLKNKQGADIQAIQQKLDYLIMHNY